jgi:hypothetical protein
MRKSIRNRGKGQAEPASSAKKSQSRRSQSQSAVINNNNNDENLYSKGDYVAFIDAADSLEKFKIAHVSLPLSDFCLIEFFRQIKSCTPLCIFKSKFCNDTYYYYCYSCMRT